MANPYEMLFGGPSAFDYFLKGQSAQQQFNANQQLEQQRFQQMAAADQAYKQQALLNPIAIQQEQEALRNAGYVGDINQGTRDYNQATQQNRIDLSNQSVTSGQQAIDSEFMAQQQSEELFPLKKQELQSGIGANTANTRLANLKIGEAQRQNSNQNILYGERAVDQYEALQQTNPELAEKFKQTSMKQLGLTPQQFNPEFIRAQAAVVKKMQAGNYEQVKDMPGIAFNKDTGNYTASAEQMQKSIDMAKKNKGQFDGKSIRDVTNDLRATTKPAREAMASASKLLALGDEATPVDQIAAAYSFIKSLDPGGVVTDRENGMLATSEGAFQGIVNLYNKAVGEGNLKNLMPEIKSTAVKMANSQIESTALEVGSILDVYSSNGNINDDQRSTFKKLVPEPLEIKAQPANENKSIAPQSKYSPEQKASVLQKYGL